MKMNKDVRHNGTLYVKGQKMDKSMDGFEELKKAGHISGDEAPLTEAELAAKAEAEAKAKAEVLAEEAAEEDDKKKKGRK